MAELRLHGWHWKRLDLIDPDESEIRASLLQAMNCLYPSPREQGFNARSKKCLITEHHYQTILNQDEGFFRIHPGYKLESHIPVLQIAWHTKRCTGRDGKTRWGQKPVKQIAILYAFAYVGPSGQCREKDLFDPDYEEKSAKKLLKFIFYKRYRELIGKLRALPWIRLTRKLGILTDDNMTDEPIINHSWHKPSYKSIYIVAWGESSAIIADRPRNPNRVQLVYTRNNKRYHVDIPKRFGDPNKPYFRKHFAKGNLFELAKPFAVKTLVMRSSGVLSLPHPDQLTIKGEVR